MINGLWFFVAQFCHNLEIGVKYTNVIVKVIIETPLNRPFGHNGHPDRSPNEHRIISRFRFQKDEGITQINTLVSEFMTYPYTHTKKFLLDILSVE